MNTLAILGALLLSGVDITVSPDQPLPFSYVDDPLIVEIRSDAVTRADITIGLESSDGQGKVSQVFPATPLGPEINRWCALKEIPPMRGPWKVTVEVRADNGESFHDAEVYRVDRPANAFVHPLYAFGDSLDRETLLALRGVGVNLVRVPADLADLADLLEEVVLLDMKAIVTLGGDGDIAAKAEALATVRCAGIERWELPATRENAAGLKAVVERLQSLECKLPISLSVRDAAAVPDILTTIAIPSLQHLVINESPEGPGVLDDLRDNLAALGVESPVLEYLYENSEADAFPPVLFDALAHHAARVGFPASLVLNGGELKSGLSYLNGLAHGVPPAPFAGSLPQPGKARALLFASGSRWTLAFWSSGTNESIAVPWSADHPFTLADSWNNTAPVEAPEGEVWKSPASGGVRFLLGEGGPIIKAPLLNQIKATIRHILGEKPLDMAWSGEVRGAMEAIAANPEGEQSRVHFFTLLRAFPEIEDRWHTGQLPRPVAVAALAHLADLSRTLCRLEGAREAGFLEPLADTLARCEEFQSLYLTGATTTPQARARGDWLVAEVRRLMDDAESLAAGGAKIEADAVAALAEWRARGLEFAAKAGPLSDQMELPKVEEPKAAEPEPEVKKEEPKKPAATKKAPAKKTSTKKAPAKKKK
ncbi:MAG: hypothetical protein JNK74_10985 [Candidatus Hydrogenedentes bacterium]|nr:hypothetical protein [Candidatus Hydrogenedentota bacterium]